MKKIAFVLYREWAYKIYEELVRFQKDCPQFEVVCLITTLEPEFAPPEGEGLPPVYRVEGKDNEAIRALLKKHGADTACYYGWSWIVKEPILSEYVCLCLHPSPLPKYRGGSPIQNQIIAGEEMSAVSVFRMGEGLDDGPIYKQEPISFAGSLADIFTRMTEAGIAITKEYALDARVIFTPQQDLDKHPPLKRRKPEDSEIPVAELPRMEYKHIYNMVRALADPYPNAYIMLGGKRVLLKGVTKKDDVPADASVVDGPASLLPENGKPIALKAKDGYAIVTSYEVA